MSVTLTSVETFDPTEAINDAISAVALRGEEIKERIVTDTERARDAAVAYAKHLAGGGDPTVSSFRPSWSEDRDTVIPSKVALHAVYENWNEARGSRNPFSPFNSPDGWKITEFLFSRFGEPILLEEIRKAERAATPDRVAKVLVILTQKTNCEIVPRKTKVAGKVAYYVRERRDGDPDTITESGYYRSRPGAGADIIEEKP